MPTTLVFTATYNEADSITELVLGIAEALPDADILVVDDSSPDGTSEILRQLQERLSNLHIIVRPGKLGLGTAHQLAMQYALHRGYEKLITMDADFSHHPRYLPTIERSLDSYDFVIGSRYMQGGASDYTGLRLFLSRFANLLVKRLLNVPLSESTTSFRGFTRKLLSKIENGRARPSGYAFFFDTVVRVSRTSVRCKEFPIHFHDRRFGHTNLSKFEILRAVVALSKLVGQRLLVPVRAGTALDQAAPLSKCEICNTSFSSAIAPAVRLCLVCGTRYRLAAEASTEPNRKVAPAEPHLHLTDRYGRRVMITINWRVVRPLVLPPGRLLEIGCAWGDFLNIAGRDGYLVAGLEPSQLAADYCKANSSFLIHHGPISDISVFPEPFHTIVAWDVIQDFPRPMEALSLINQKLTLGGKLIFSIPAVDGWPGRSGPVRRSLNAGVHAFYFTRQAIRNVLELSGFRVVFIRLFRSKGRVSSLCGLRTPATSNVARLESSYSADCSESMLLPSMFPDSMLVCATTVDERRDYPGRRL